ncbi:LysR family transcriptional regulator [Bradyrhizobium sp.]|jgi:DNA-binding transcriptional LysR family regulator|uniref:LysR family transcriptional regulator n=1 Tax=Bradyrhizobium sp. TaxID=376 RepID=UPI002DDCDF8A|nr:LysR family transcriptional regulator [Bradyrhizobium sp.]HEV2159538.1 LysR family transcriptional regulator [Bradyrhizobium sp.]
MKRDDLYDLAAFAVVAEHGSFTRAAAELGMSQSALSHALKALEERLGVRLLSRTTRSVSTTEAGETLLRSLRPALDEISSGVSALGALRGKPSGTVRVTATKHAVSSVVMPVLPRFLASHPDIRLDIIVDDNLTDIVADRIDAGIRFGDIVEKDMIAVRIGPDIRMAVVGAPSYFADHPVPKTPRDLAAHRCINYRHVRSGGLYAWDFEEKGRPLEVRVEGPLVFNNAELTREAALAGQGIAYVYADEVAADVQAGRLKRILEKWCPIFPGYYLYHPSRRQTPPALAALIAALRYKP